MNLILYTKPSTHLIAGQKGVDTSIGRSDVEKRLEVLKEACEKNSSLLTVVEELGSSTKGKLSAM